jgi:hypothetical protein
MLNGIGFETMIASPSDYENLVAEIYFDGKFVAMVSQEKGIGIFDLEMPGIRPVETLMARKVELHGFLEAIEVACKRLKVEPQ